MLYDIDTSEWDDALLAQFRIPPSLLPRIVPSSGAVGAARAEWFGRAIPIAGIAGDQQAALFGQGCHARGMAKNTYGTGCFLLLAHRRDARADAGHGLLATRAAELSAPADAGPKYALEGSVFIGGAVVQWLRDG